MKILRSGSILAFTLLALAAHAQSAYSTGFEAPTYAAGTTVVATDGWIAGSGTAPQTVSSARAFAGSQSLAFADTSTSSFNSVRHAYGFVAGTAYAASVKLYVGSNTGTSRLYGMYLATTTLGGTTLGMSIGGDGGIRTGTSWSATYAPTPNATAPAGTFADRWLTLDFTLNGSGGGTTKVSGFSDGATYSYSFTGITSTAAYVNLGADYTSAAVAGSGYFDGFSVAPQAVPEPSALAALGLGAVALLRRRRK